MIIHNTERGLHADIFIYYNTFNIVNSDKSVITIGAHNFCCLVFDT